MAKIERYNGNVQAFASESLGTERTVFGDTTQSDALSDQLTDEFKRGWGIVGASDFPSIQDFSASMFTATQFISYLHQMGVAEWNAEQEYQTAGAMCIYAGKPWVRGASWSLGDIPGTSANWNEAGTEGKLFSASGGYQKFSSKFIIQWGSINSNVASNTIITSSYPIAFPTGPLSVSILHSNGGSITEKTSINLISLEASQFSFNLSASGTQSVRYIAMGC